MHLTLFGPSEQQFGRTSFPITIETTGQILRIPKYVPLTVRLETFGIHHLVASTDLGDVLSTRIAVVRREG